MPNAGGDPMRHRVAIAVLLLSLAAAVACGDDSDYGLIQRLPEETDASSSHSAAVETSRWSMTTLTS
jgi:hypothetical protein